MATVIRERYTSAKERVIEKSKGKTKLSGWVLNKEKTSFADDGSYSNIDSDVTPLDRRTWGNWTLLGFWFSDALNAQGWEAPSSIIAAGLTWREAVYLSKSLKLLCMAHINLGSYYWLHDGHCAIDAQRHHWRPLSHSISSCGSLIIRLLLFEICRGSKNDHSVILAW